MKNLLYQEKLEVIHYGGLSHHSPFFFGRCWLYGSSSFGLLWVNIVGLQKQPRHCFRVRRGQRTCALWMFVYRDCLLFLHRGPSWSANQMWTSLTVSITRVPQCWKVKASVLTAEKRPARPRRSPLPRLTPPPLCPLLLNMGQPRLEPSRAEQTRPLAGKNATLELFCLFITKCRT